MSERKTHCFTLLLAAFLLAVPAVQSGAARHHRKASISHRPVSSWSRIELRHVSPHYVLDALQQGRQWHALLHGTRGRSLEGVSLVIPGNRNSALFVRGTRVGLRQLRQIVGLLDIPASAAHSSVPVATATQAYQMVLRGEWQRSIHATRGLLSRSPGNAEASALQAYSLIKSDKPDEAETPATRALRQTEGQTGHARALALVAVGSLAEARGNRPQAVAYFQNAGNADISCALAYLAFADYAHKNGRNSTAKKLLQAALSEVKTEAERDAVRAHLGGL